MENAVGGVLTLSDKLLSGTEEGEGEEDGDAFDGIWTHKEAGDLRSAMAWVDAPAVTLEDIDAATCPWTPPTGLESRMDSRTVPSLAPRGYPSPSFKSPRRRRRAIYKSSSRAERRHVHGSRVVGPAATRRLRLGRPTREFTRQGGA